MATSHLHLLPPLVETGRIQDLIKSGETINASHSPRGNSLAVFLTSSVSLSFDALFKQVNAVPKTSAPVACKEQSDEEIPLYFTSTHTAPSNERRLFITDTIVIFSTLQGLVKNRIAGDPRWTQNDETVSIVRKLAIDYVNFIKELWFHASQLTSDDPPLQFSGDHYRSMYSCFALFVVLFLPEPDYEDAPVGEELMEWLNIHFIQPSTEEGDQLSTLDRPWEDSNFWSYLTRATIRGLTKATVFFLKTLAQHESESLRDLTKKLIPLISTQPRLSNFNSEKDFMNASRKWKERIQTIRVEMDRIPESERADDFDDWWDRLSDIVGILEGRWEILQRVCDELECDWKEVCAAWGVFVDTRLRRQDLPDVVADVLDLMPPDSTIPEDMVHSALFSSQLGQALTHASSLDPWLSAHLSDIMSTLSLIETDIDTESELSRRDQYVLSYAEYLHSDPTLWRITLAYMYSCGDIGKERADEVLLRVPLQLQEQRTKVTSGESEGIVGTLKDLNQMCFDYEREGARRAMCRIAAQTFVNEKDYGLAVSYCMSAEDWPGLGRLVDRVLEEYFHSGPEKFSQFAADISPSLQSIRENDGADNVFVYRLVFVVRYSQFHHLRLKKKLKDAASDLIALLQEVAPKSWWAVLLCDCIELLQHGSGSLFPPSGPAILLERLEEITTKANQGAGDEYLTVLSRRQKVGGHKGALEQLKMVRLALAKYIAQCAIGGIEGDGLVYMQ